MAQIPSLIKDYPNHFFDEVYNVAFMQFYFPSKRDNEQLFKKTDSGLILDFKEYKKRLVIDYYKLKFPKFINTVFKLSKKDKLTILYPPPSQVYDEGVILRNNPKRLRDFLETVWSDIICDELIMPDLFERIKTVDSKSHSLKKHNDSIQIRNGLLSKDASFIKKSKIIFFDDVLTTGATMAACANKLEEALNTKKLDLNFITLAGTTSSQLTAPRYQNLIFRTLEDPFA